MAEWLVEVTRSVTLAVLADDRLGAQEAAFAQAWEWVPESAAGGDQGSVSIRVTRPPQEIVALCTLQFANGGLIDAQPADGYLVHLVRQNGRQGTPGPTLCGVDRFAPDAPGWSVSGGTSGPAIVHKPCPGCATAAREQFPGLPVTGSIGGKEMAAELGVEWRRH